MHELFAAAILGIVQGLTEFLPVSSTGHLILTSALMGLDDARTQTFEVVIQFGSILAVVALYFPRFRGLLFPQKDKAFSGLRGLWLLFLTCLPASLLGLFAHTPIKQYLFKPLPVALSLAVGAVMILVVERFKPAPRRASIDEMTPLAALGVGCFQCLSLWPGFSRSASTIMGGMLTGSSRATAAEYSFIAAVPIMFAATAFDLYNSASFLSAADIPFFAVGLLFSFVFALLAIKVFVGLVSRISLRPFAWYRLALAPVVFFFFPV